MTRVIVRAGHGLVLAATVASLAGLVLARRNLRFLDHLATGTAAPAQSVPEQVSVLIPARDEAATLPPLLSDISALEGLRQLQVLVLDDDSADDTAATAEAAAASDPRMTVIRSHDRPPPGWLGKPYACDRLARAATGSVLVFVDADVRLGPRSVAAAVDRLRHRQADLLSAWPGQLATSPLARLVQPLQQWSWLTTLPLDVAYRRGRPSLTAANGQFLVADAATYRAVGGHAAVRDRVLDDIALARVFKRAGRRVELVDASAAATCLMYPDDRALIDGYTKSLWSAFGGPARGLAAAGTLAAVALAPPGYALLGRRRSLRLAAAAGYAATVTSRVIAARATGGRAWPDSLAHPLSVTAFAALMAVSVRRHRAGTLRWRGRAVTTR